MTGIVLFDSFPHLENDKIIIRKMEEKDVDALAEITDNEHVYQYISPFLHKRSRNYLATVIRNIGARDFEKKKWIIAGIYVCNDPSRLIGLAEMFDFQKKANCMTIGYRINEAFWHQGIATNAIELMVKYLSGEMGIHTLRAFVMPDNRYSSKALLKNGFQKELEMVQEKNWGGQAVVDVEVYTFHTQDAKEGKHNDENVTGINVSECL